MARPSRRRAAQMEPTRLARVLFGAAALPSTDQLRLAASWRWSQIVSECADSTPGIARRLGVSARHVQRLRLLYPA